MSDRRQNNQARRLYGVPRALDPSWQLPRGAWLSMIAHQAFAKRPVVERRWRVRTDAGTVTVVRKLR